MDEETKRQTGHPANHGFVRCYRCRTMIQKLTALEVQRTPGEQQREPSLVWCCKDTSWCDLRFRVKV